MNIRVLVWVVLVVLEGHSLCSSAFVSSNREQNLLQPCRQPKEKTVLFDGPYKDPLEGCTKLNTTVPSSSPTRRKFLFSCSSTIFGNTLGVSSSLVSAAEPYGDNSGQRASTDSFEPSTSLTVPITFTGQELIVSYTVDGSPFRAILDTGSPFLMIPGSCSANTQQKSGCYRNQGVVSGLEDTIELFDGFEGVVAWRRGTFDFANAEEEKFKNSTEASGAMTLFNGGGTLADGGKPLVTFGVASESIMVGPGGVFFGMIRDTDTRIRPSFLGQTNVQAFEVDLASRPRKLTLSTTPLVGIKTDSHTQTDYIPMTNLLRRRYGDPVGHYTVRAQTIEVNGYILAEETRSKPILVIVDTGVTGMVVSRGLFNEQYVNARKRKDRNLFGNVTITFATASSSSKQQEERKVALSAAKPLTTPFDPERTWKKFPADGYLIVMGLAFLEDRILTIDIDNERLWVA